MVTTVNRLGGWLSSVPVLGRATRTVRRRYREWKFDPVRNIRRAFGRQQDAYVVQIGSNDGITGDPIHSLLSENPSWRALLIEPVPFLFERLKQNYAFSSRFRFENVAIAESVGTSQFYYVDQQAKKRFPSLPDWYDQLGSFDRGHIARHFGSQLDDYIVAADIPTLPLATVLARNDVDRIDLLHIDAEGSEWLILRQLRLEQWAPTVILFEHKHLSEASKTDARAFLQDRYKLVDLGEDYFCRRVSPGGTKRASLGHA